MSPEPTFCYNRPAGRARAGRRDAMFTSLANLIARRTPIEWVEGVAIVKALGAKLLEEPDAGRGGVPDFEEIVITSEGDVMLMAAAGGEGHPVNDLGRLLAALVPASEMPAALQVLTDKALLAAPAYRDIAALMEALSYFERPDAPSLIRAVYDRWLLLPPEETEPGGLLLHFNRRPAEMGSREEPALQPPPPAQHVAAELPWAQPAAGPSAAQSPALAALRIARSEPEPPFGEQSVAPQQPTMADVPQPAAVVSASEAARVIVQALWSGLAARKVPLLVASAAAAVLLLVAVVSWLSFRPAPAAPAKGRASLPQASQAAAAANAPAIVASDAGQGALPAGSPQPAGPSPTTGAAVPAAPPLAAQPVPLVTARPGAPPPGTVRGSTAAASAAAPLVPVGTSTTLAGPARAATPSRNRSARLSPRRGLARAEPPASQPEEEAARRTVTPPPPVPAAGPPTAAATPRPRGPSEETADDRTVYSAESRDVTAPVPVRPMQPSAPRRGARVEDLPAVELLVSATGEVESIRLLRPTDDVLTWVNLSVVKSWRFLPARRNGRPVRYRQIIQLTGR